jgi:hypothetical protein
MPLAVMDRLHALTEGRSRGTGFGYDYGMMPIYYISLSLTRPQSAADSDILELLRRAAESATCGNRGVGSRVAR